MRTVHWLLTIGFAVVVSSLFVAGGQTERIPSKRSVAAFSLDVEPIERLREFECTSNVRDPGPILLRRLTVPEYVETVRAALGVDVAKEAEGILPPDVRTDGFANTAYNLNVDLGHVEAYARLAEIVVVRADVPAFVAKHTKCRKLDDVCLRDAIARIGKRLLRGPLEGQEVDAYLTVANAVKAEKGSFDEALGYVVEAMLQSPRFLYLREVTTGDGRPRLLSDHEIAVRTSYILWGGPPDDELFRAADAGELRDPKRHVAQVRRMLDDPRAVERSLRFVEGWLNLGQLESLRPNAERFPGWDARLAADMRAETRAFFEEVAWNQKRPLAELFNAPFTFATPRLAAHYGFAWNPEGEAARAGDSVASPGDGGPEVLYTFEEGKGNIVRDRSGTDDPIDLVIEKPAAVKWGDGQLTLTDTTLIASKGAPSRLIEAVRKSGAITIEAWITPALKKQEGPARIVTLSSGSNERNFTLGQDGDKYDVRLRSSRTSTNGIPSVGTPGGTVETRPAHVAYTRDKTGRPKIYVEGKLVKADNVDGDLGNWDGSFRLALGNELSNDRPWKGTLHRVAIYSRALAPEEIGTRGGGLRKHDLTNVPGRGGLLTQGSILTVGGDDASMVTRGLFVLHDVLGSGVDDPPPCVDTTPIPPEIGVSRRDVAEGRVADPACGGCHQHFEPLAFGLEKFDGIGAFHEKDELGNANRWDGQILFPGRDEANEFATTAELADLLAGSDRVRDTLTLKVTQFALGRPLVKTDACHLKEIQAAAKRDGGTYAALIAAIVTSDLVRQTRTEEKR